MHSSLRYLIFCPVLLVVFVLSYTFWPSASFANPKYQQRQQQPTEEVLPKIHKEEVQTVSSQLFYPRWFPHWPTLQTLNSEEINDRYLFEKSLADLGERNEDSEDEYAISSFFNGLRNGTIFEMGAMNGDEKSVSKTFERLFGWKSLLIEANPAHAEGLARNRPDAVSGNIIVCKPGEHRTLHLHKDSRSISTIVELARMDFLRRFLPHLTKFDYVDRQWKLNEAVINLLPEVQCTSLKSVFDAAQLHHVNFFVLDCEGCELEALSTVGIEKGEVVVDVLVVEVNPSKKNENERSEEEKQYQKDIVQFMTNFTTPTNGDSYELFAELGRNIWFKRVAFTPSQH